MAVLYDQSNSTNKWYFAFIKDLFHHNMTAYASTPPMQYKFEWLKVDAAVANDVWTSAMTKYHTSEMGLIPSTVVAYKEDFFFGGTFYKRQSALGIVKVDFNGTNRA